MIRYVMVYNTIPFYVCGKMPRCVQVIKNKIKKIDRERETVPSCRKNFEIQTCKAAHMPKQSTTGERRNLTEESPQGRSPQINGRVCFFVFFRVFLSRNCRFEPPLLLTSLLDLFLYNVIVCKISKISSVCLPRHNTAGTSEKPPSEKLPVVNTFHFLALGS
jgi:hypothetical protein